MYNNVIHFRSKFYIVATKRDNLKGIFIGGYTVLE